jgi:AraC-like DNA-binding protein
MYTIEYCGYNIHNPNRDIIYRPNGSISYLLLLILAPMNFEINGETIPVKAGACILYTPGFPQRYQAVNEFYNSYIHFFTESEMEPQFGLPLNTIFYPEGMDEINWFIKNIHKEHITKAMHYEKLIDTLLWQILIHLDRNIRKSMQEVLENTSLYSEFQSLRLQMLTYCEEDWTIERLCQAVNLEKSQVYAYYHKFFHTTPKAELINARIDKAKYLLMNEALQISQVARMSGFNDIYHFSRCFKKVCGCSPSSFGTEINGKKKAFLHCDNN